MADIKVEKTEKNPKYFVKFAGEKPKNHKNKDGEMVRRENYTIGGNSFALIEGEEVSEKIYNAFAPAVRNNYFEVR
jgi:hypothetical protein